MKNDPLLSILVNFLIPIILLCALFFLIDFFNSGFFAFLYSIVLLVSAFLLFLAKYCSDNSTPPKIVELEFLLFFVFLVSACYVFSLIFFITDFLKI